MPWLETDPVNERKRFVLETQGGLFSHSELCRRYGISRKTGYKWLDRYEREGPNGLTDRSHRPHSCPHATDPEVLEAAFELRRHRPRSPPIPRKTRRRGRRGWRSRTRTCFPPIQVRGFPWLSIPGALQLCTSGHNAKQRLIVGLLRTPDPSWSSRSARQIFPHTKQ